MASNPYSRDSSRTWSTRSCVEQFGIYREAPVKPYNYYKNNSRFIRTGVVAVMLAIVVLLVFLMITDISKTNGTHRSREKDAFLRLLSASQENNNKTSSLKPSTSTLAPSAISTSSTPPSTVRTSSTEATRKPQDHTNHKTAEDYPVHNFNFHDDSVNYDWNEGEEVSPRDLTDRKLHDLTRLKPPNRRYDDLDHDIHIHIPAGPGYGSHNRGDKTSRPYNQGHRVYTAPDGTEHHEISYKEPASKPSHRDIPLYWEEGHKASRPPSNYVFTPPPPPPPTTNSVFYHGERVPANHRRPDYFERPIVVLDGPSDVKVRSQKPRPPSDYYGNLDHRQPSVPATDFRVYNHHAHNLSEANQKGVSPSKTYPQYWRPYLDDLNHVSSKKETRIVNKNPYYGEVAASKPYRKVKTKKQNATRQSAASNKFPQLLNYHYPKDAKNIGDIIKFLNRFEPPQKEDTTPLFDTNLGKIMKLKGVYVTHINDDADADADANTEINMSNGHAYNADPFQAYKPENMADINYLMPNELRLPTQSNQFLFKNTIRHLNEQKNKEQNGNNKFFPRPPIKYFSNAPMSHQNYNSPVEAYTTAIYHPWSTSTPKTRTPSSKPNPMSVMLDVFPMDAEEAKPSRGKRKPFKTLKLNLDKEAAASGKRQQMILHLNLYPRKKQKANSRSDNGNLDSAPSYTVNFNSDTHEITPVKRYYNEDYEGEIRRSDDDYVEDDEDYEYKDEKINATLKNTDDRESRHTNATYETEYEREGEEVDFRINIVENEDPSDDDFEFEETSTPATNREVLPRGVVVEHVSEKPPGEERTTEMGDSLVTVYPTKSLDMLESLLEEKSKYVARDGGHKSNKDNFEFDRRDVLSI